MKRREFLAASGGAAALTVFAFADRVRALVPQLNPETRGPEVRVFNDAQHAGELLKAHFAKYPFWHLTKDDYGRSEKPAMVKEVVINQYSAAIDYNHCLFCVDKNTTVTIYENDAILVHHFAGSGRELNWHWEPMTHAEFTRYYAGELGFTPESRDRLVRDLADVEPDKLENRLLNIWYSEKN